MENKRVLQTTVTGEAVQPIRLYYQVVDKELLIKKFKQLRCLDFDSDSDRWVWLYDHESKVLKFKFPYVSIPKEMHPIVIGSFFLRNEEGLLLDLRSFDRAIEAIPFFDKYVGRAAARITCAAVVNRFFDAKELFPPNLDIFFGSDEFMEKDMVRNTSEIEKFPVHFYEDGLGSVRAVLQIRQAMAVEHWKGNTDCTVYDIIKSATSGKMKGK